MRNWLAAVALGFADVVEAKPWLFRRRPRSFTRRSTIVSGRRASGRTNRFFDRLGALWAKSPPGQRSARATSISVKTRLATRLSTKEPKGSCWAVAGASACRATSAVRRDALCIAVRASQVQTAAARGASSSE